MKCNVSATLEKSLVERARKEARQQRRSFSNFLERALEQALAGCSSAGLVTSRGRFLGRFVRVEGGAER
jgi:hypothetical protein